MRLDDIEDLIRQGQLEEALDGLVAFTESSAQEYREEFIVFQQRLKEARREQHVLSNTTPLHRLSLDVLEMADEMVKSLNPESKTFENQKIKQKIRLALAMISGDKRRNVILIVMLLIAVCAIGYYTLYHLIDRLDIAGWSASGGIASLCIKPFMNLYEAVRKSNDLRLVDMHYSTFDRRAVEKLLNEFFHNRLI